jgi:segregation and condensation protein B
MNDHKRIMEAALFISNTPLTLDQLARISGINSLGHVKEIMESLQKSYEGRGLEIFNSSDGWVMQVRASLLPRVAHLTPYSDLGEGPKRTLALVTLKEPVKQSEIIKTQGNKAYSYIKELKKRGLIVTEKVGHTKILKLTNEFERYFGEEKGKIKEQLERHLHATRTEGEPVYDRPEEREEEYIEQRTSQKEKANVSFTEKDEPKIDHEEEEKPPKKIKSSHDHAFREIE